MSWSLAGGLEGSGVVRSTAFSIAAVAVAGLNALALAGGDNLQAGERIRFTDREGNTGGGEFGVFYTSGTKNTSQQLFRTFCLERNEYVDFDVAGFYIESISDAVKSGGLGGPSPDPLDVRTAWLYYNFRSGDLAAYGYNYTPGTQRGQTANAFQKAIWKIEGELSDNLTGLALTFYNAAAAATSGPNAWTNDGRVAVLNIVWATDRGFGVGTNAQSMLVLIPLPGAGGLAAAGLLALGVRRRR